MCDSYHEVIDRHDFYPSDIAVCSGSFLRSLLISKAAVALEDGVVEGANFVEEAQGWLLRSPEEWGLSVGLESSPTSVVLSDHRE
jgi:hypothetical protein